MMFLLKLAVLLVCIQRGDNHRLRFLLEQRREMESPSNSPGEGETSGEASKGDSPKESFGAGEPSGQALAPGPIRVRRASPESHCGLRTVLLEVRDLGLGYDSDETVLFKYCSGFCPRARSNHDLTLTKLLLSGLLPNLLPGELWYNAPCCRPTHYEDLAFLDNSHRWHKVEKLSAADCSCLG